MRRTHIVIACVAGPALLLGWPVGCSSTKAKPASQAPPVAAPRSLLGAGDEIELRFYYTPELNTQQRIRPDGKITLQLIGDIDAAGRSPTQFADELEAAYGGIVRRPDLSVIVRGSYKQRVMVGGAVLRPGPIDMPADMSLFEGVLMAGGFNLVTAHTAQVIVMRQLEDGKRQGYAVDMRDELKGATTDPFMLQAGDIVYVPRTPIADVNQFIEQYINGLVPDVGIVYTVQLQNGSISFDPNRN